MRQTFIYNGKFLRGSERETESGVNLLLAQMKPLLPTLKEKKRYIGFEVLATHELPKPQFKQAVLNGVKEYIGVLGMAKAGVVVISLSGNKGILRVGNKHVNDVKAALVFIKRIGKQAVAFRSVATSGTLKALKKKIYGEAS